MGFFRILNAVGDSSRVSKNGTGLYLLEFVSKLNLSLPFQNELKGREVLVCGLFAFWERFFGQPKIPADNVRNLHSPPADLRRFLLEFGKDLPGIGYLLGEMIFFGFHESALKVKNRYAIVKDIHW